MTVKYVQVFTDRLTQTVVEIAKRAACKTGWFLFTRTLRHRDVHYAGGVHSQHSCSSKILTNESYNSESYIVANRWQTAKLPKIF